MTKKKQKADINIFNGKERKETQQQIDELKRKLEELENGLAEKQSALQGAKERAEKACSAIMMPLLRSKAKIMRKLQELDVSKDELPKLDIPQTIEFGRYLQGKNGSAAPIEWVVLELTAHGALLISKYALDCKPYNASETGVTWQSCTLRKWLNEAFFKVAFSDKEKATILTVTVSADKNPDYITNSGNATQDKVFLLSIAEVNRYFKSDEERMCVPTAYAKKKGAYAGKDYTKGGAATCRWWLRSPGCSQRDALSVDRDGSANSTGEYVWCGVDGVRPAMWIDLSD